MAGIFETFVKKFITKRVDAAAWNIGPGNISGIRMLTDPQNPNHILGIATVAFDPQGAVPLKPITPASQSDVSVDPINRLGALSQLDVPHTFTAKTNSIERILGATVGVATNKYMTFEQPTGTDYVVPAGKVLLIYHEIYQSGLVTAPAEITYGDDGVAEGTSAPANEVFPPGSLSGAAVGLMHSKVVDQSEEFNIPVLIPAGKYPCLNAISTSLACAMVVHAVEYDA